MSLESRMLAMGNRTKLEVEDYIFSYGTKELKNVIRSRYGYEIKGCDGSGANIQLLNEWLKQMDPEHETRKKNKVSGYIIDTQYIFAVDINTFVYVRAGSKNKSMFDIFLDARDNRDGRDRADYQLYLYIFGQKAKKYFDLCTEHITRANSTALDIYNVSGNKNGGKEDQFNSIVSDLHTRNMDTLFFEPGVKDKIISHIDTFIDSTDIYKERDLLYKTGILLHGKPGTGKTSLASAIATYYNSSLIVVDMTTFDTLNTTILTQCINADDCRYIVLLEDIDTIFNLDRETNTADKDDKKVINKLLQFLDSNNSPNNVIFVATTNHIEVLDEAITRNGRFDLKVEVGGIMRTEAEKMCKSFNLDQKSINNILDNCEFPVNQSSLQQQILSSFKPDKAKLLAEESEKEDNIEEDLKLPEGIIMKPDAKGTKRYYRLDNTGKLKQIRKAEVLSMLDII